MDSFVGDFYMVSIIVVSSTYEGYVTIHSYVSSQDVGNVVPISDASRSSKGSVGS